MASGDSLSRRLALLIILRAGWPLGCAGSGEQVLDLPPNPAGCEEVVRRFEENPDLAVDAPPRPRILGDGTEPQAGRSLNYSNR